MSNYHNSNKHMGKPGQYRGADLKRVIKKIVVQGEKFKAYRDKKK